MALADLGFNLGSPSGPASPAAVVEVGVVRVGFSDIWDQHFLVSVRTALHDHVALGQILQNFREPLSAIERRGDLVGVGARKLKEDVGADSHDGGAHLRRILLQELIRGYNRDSEFACFRK